MHGCNDGAPGGRQGTGRADKTHAVATAPRRGTRVELQVPGGFDSVDGAAISSLPGRQIKPGREMQNDFTPGRTVPWNGGNDDWVHQRLALGRIQRISHSGFAVEQVVIDYQFRHAGAALDR